MGTKEFLSFREYLHLSSHLSVVIDGKGLRRR